MASAVDRPQAQNRADIIFTYGNPPVQVRWQNSTEFLPGFEAIPSIALRFPPNTPDLAEGELQIDVPILDGVNDAFLERITSGIAMPPTKIEVRELVTAVVLGDTSSNSVLFRGLMDVAELNPEDRTRMVRITCIPEKNLLKAKVGLQCNVTCEWRLFGRGCATGDGFGGMGSEGPQFGLERRSMGVATRTGRVVTVTSGWTPIDPNKTFVRGFMSFGGLNIDIQSWQVGTPDIFVLDRPAPAEWIGQTVFAYPGCDLTKEHCDSAWANNGRFGGFGIGMPDYTPEFERGG
jgi:hypothetical protein